jgi:phosphopentomutase
LAGLVLNQPFPTYPRGFPKKIISQFTNKTGYEILGNYPASGTEILKELGEAHLATGKPIIYTSADSVFQIAAHEQVIPLAKLYEICQAARDILQGEHAVARVIARPFIGDNQHNFVRTKYRKDFSLKPPGKTILNILQEAHIPTVAIGKINDLYAYQGIDQTIITKTNHEGMNALSQALEQYPKGFIMANLVDFDMLWGHRNDITGFKAGLEDFDRWLVQYKKHLATEDILFITSDHGNDPTTPSTDHSREYVPILVYGNALKSGVNLDTRTTFADLQATLSDYFSVLKGPYGTSFFNLIIK